MVYFSMADPSEYQVVPLKSDQYCNRCNKINEHARKHCPVESFNCTPDCTFSVEKHGGMINEEPGSSNQALSRHRRKNIENYKKSHPGQLEADKRGREERKREEANELERKKLEIGQQIANERMYHEQSTTNLRDMYGQAILRNEETNAGQQSPRVMAPSFGSVPHPATEVFQELHEDQHCHKCGTLHQPIGCPVNKFGSGTLEHHTQRERSSYTASHPLQSAHEAAVHRERTLAKLQEELANLTLQDAQAPWLLHEAPGEQSAAKFAHDSRVFAIRRQIAALKINIQAGQDEQLRRSENSHKAGFQYPQHELPQQTSQNDGYQQPSGDHTVYYSLGARSRRSRLPRATSLAFCKRSQLGLPKITRA
ncbi:hypothetical protein T439DRAFT_353806 [Meredithblackwellia eburnea MCA 4105]